MVRRTNRFPFRGGVPPEEEEDDTTDDETEASTTDADVLEGGDVRLQTLADQADEEMVVSQEGGDVRLRTLSERLEEEEEDEPEPTSIADLVSEADPEEFNRTFRLTKNDIPLAVGDEIPIGFPFEGIPRVAMVFNFNYVWDDDENQWIKDEGNGPFTVVDQDTVSVNSGFAARSNVGLDDATLALNVDWRLVSPDPPPNRFEKPSLATQADSFRPVEVSLVYNVTLPGWQVAVQNNSDFNLTLEFVVYEVTLF